MGETAFGLMMYLIALLTMGGIYAVIALGLAFMGANMYVKVFLMRALVDDVLVGEAFGALPFDPESQREGVHLAVGVDQEGAAFDAAHLFAIHVLHLDNVELIAQLFFSI